jgi:hypothetical protein
MQMKKLWLTHCVALLAISAGAQTPVTTSGGTTGTLPVYTGSATLGNSPIAVSGSNVGIGTTSPGASLDARSIGGGNIYRASDSSGQFRWRLDQLFGMYLTNASATDIVGIPQSGNIFFNTGGNIGIGTTEPGASLQIGIPSTTGGAVGAFSPVLQTFSSTVLNSTAGTDLPLATIGFATGNNVGLGIHGFRTSTGSTWTTAAIGLGMDVDNVTRAGANIWLNASGNVGIGTSSPGATLEVSGTTKMDGPVTFPDLSIQSTAWNGTLAGADYAESVDVTGDRSQYEPGDVLTIAPGVVRSFREAAEPYSKLVAGIYSTKPGVLGKQATTDADHLKDEVPLAMVGIVPTKVSAENGPIQIGDLLVTSTKAGYAMKGTDPSKMLGAVLGKALGALDSGTGMIEVLVTLQ